MNYSKKDLLSYADFPTPGTTFYDLAPLLAQPESFRHLIHALAERVQRYDYDVIAATDARGFIYSGALAFHCAKALVLVRKAGKLPGVLQEVAYDLEYGQNVLALQQGVLKPGQRVLVIDDVLATGGTAQAVVQLIEATGAVVAALAFPLEITALKGRACLPYAVETLIEV